MRNQAKSQSSEQIDKDSKQQKVLSVEKKQKNGGVRMCAWCFKAKPDRCHHCSQCSKCILKMDHHCPWVANCIGFNNYKYFFCMIFNCMVVCWIIDLTSWPVLIRALVHPEAFDYRIAYFIVTCYVLCCVLTIMITLFVGFHLWLIKC